MTDAARITEEPDRRGIANRCPVSDNDCTWPRCKCPRLEPHLYATIQRLTSALEKAEREKEKLREALKPFADTWGRYFDDGWSDGDSIDEIELLNVGDLRRARAALSEGVG